MRYHRKTYSAASQEATIDHVVSHISSCCSATDDPEEFKDFIRIEVSEENEDGSRTITGILDGHEPKAAYLGFTGYPDVPRNKSSTVHEPVDLTPDELQIHLEKKFGVNP